MTVLTRFPSRIRFVNPDGTLTPEALRMLDALVSRAGGTIGDSGVDMFAAPSTDDGAAGAALDIVAPVMPDMATAGPADVVAPGTLAGYMSPVDMQPAGAGGFFETTFQGSSE